MAVTALGIPLSFTIDSTPDKTDALDSGLGRIKNLA
jgi:hypothetical protein